METLLGHVDAVTSLDLLVKHEPKFIVSHTEHFSFVIVGQHFVFLRVLKANKE